jgi:ribosomal protein L34
MRFACSRRVPLTPRFTPSVLSYHSLASRVMLSSHSSVLGSWFHGRGVVSLIEHWCLETAPTTITASTAAAATATTKNASWLEDLKEAVGAFGLWLIKRTYQPSKLKRKRKYGSCDELFCIVICVCDKIVGFLERLKTKDGRNCIARRRLKVGESIRLIVCVLTTFAGAS